MHEPIAVEARFDPDGRIVPLAFLWKGQRIPVHTQGRQWRDEGAYHFLVMDPGQQVYELVFSPSDSTWKLVRAPADFKPHGHAL
jgi:hypothetical protein